MIFAVVICFLHVARAIRATGRVLDFSPKTFTPVIPMSLRDSRRLPGLSTLLTIVIAAATLLVTGLMVWIVGGIATTDIKRTVGEILAERARTAADMIDDNMATRYLEVRQLAERIDRDSAYAGRATAARRALLEQVQTSAPQYALSLIHI